MTPVSRPGTCGGKDRHQRQGVTRVSKRSQGGLKWPPWCFRKFFVFNLVEPDGIEPTTS